MSIVIPAFNEEAILGDTLERLERALRANPVAQEIIVCDNNSTDSTAAITSRLGAKVVTEPVNQISRARNTGAAAAAGEWLLFLDADSYPPPKLLAETLAFIEGGEHIGCGSTITVEGGTLFNKLRMERLNPLFRLFRLCGGVYLVQTHDIVDTTLSGHR